MRRILAAAVLGGALFAAAACGNDNGGDGGDAGDTTGPTQAAGSLSTEEVCAAGDELGAELETQYEQAGEALVTAAASGDEAAMTEAAEDFAVVSADMAGRLRDLAADAQDAELRTALEDFATELEGLGEALAADPTSLETLDATGLEEATARMEEFCPSE